MATMIVECVACHNKIKEVKDVQKGDQVSLEAYQTCPKCASSEYIIKWR